MPVFPWLWIICYTLLLSDLLLCNELWFYLLDFAKACVFLDLGFLRLVGCSLENLYGYDPSVVHSLILFELKFSILANCYSIPVIAKLAFGRFEQEWNKKVTVMGILRNELLSSGWNINHASLAFPKATHSQEIFFLMSDLFFW